MTESKKIVATDNICFGLNRETDEASLVALCEKFSSKELLSVLTPRLSEKELKGFVDTIFSLINTHLSKKEYHQLLLQNQNPEGD